MVKSTNSLNAVYHFLNVIFIRRQKKEAKIKANPHKLKKCENIYFILPFKIPPHIFKKPHIVLYGILF